jgi:hypothetical protein
MRKLGITILGIFALLLIAFMSIAWNRVRTEVEAEYSSLPATCLPNCPSDISAKRK